MKLVSPARAVRQAKLEKPEARALLARLELQVQEKRERREHRAAREKLVLLVPPALLAKQDQLEARALLVRVALLVRQELRAHQEAPEDPVKQELRASLALVGRQVRRAILDPQVKLVKQGLLDPQEPQEPRG